MVKFIVSFRIETETAAGFLEESFEDYVCDTDERTCFENKSNRCLPDAIQLSMSLQGASGEIVSDSQVINLCVRPCKPELFE